MNTPCRSGFAVLLALSAAHAFATGVPNSPPPPAPTPIPLPDATQPSAALTPYITRLEPLLALEATGNPPTQEFCSAASGNLLVLRQQFVARGTAAPAEEKQRFAAAAATCDLLTQALEERQKTIGDILSSRQVRASGKLEAPARKENLTQGIQGGGVAKAVGAVVERDRERQFIALGNAQARNGDAAMEAMAFNRWNQRAIDWRKRIAASFAQIR